MNRQPINHELTSNLCNTIDRSLTKLDNLALYEQVISGDESAREKMIVGNMPLVLTKVEMFLSEFPRFEFLRDDLQSAGFVALTEAVHSMATTGRPESPNPVGYMSVTIYRALGRLCDSESMVRVPNRTARRKRSQNKPVNKPRTTEILSADIANDRQVAEFERIDLTDSIEACCHCKEERMIVHLRGEGHSDEEIARVIGMPKTTTYMIRREIYDRFLSMSRMKA